MSVFILGLYLQKRISQSMLYNFRVLKTVAIK